MDNCQGLLHNSGFSFASDLSETRFLGVWSSEPKETVQLPFDDVQRMVAFFFKIYRTFKPIMIEANI
jgi:DICT domain-containing protein